MQRPQRDEEDDGVPAPDGIQAPVAYVNLRGGGEVASASSRLQIKSPKGGDGDRWRVLLVASSHFPQCITPPNRTVVGRPERRGYRGGRGNEEIRPTDPARLVC